MKTYFISYNYSYNEEDGYKSGFGNITVERANSFTSSEELNEIGNEIAEHYNHPKDSVVILNFQLLG